MHAQANSDSPQHPRSISDKKRQANQANAQNSTGPRTPQGKSRSAQNALRHGGFSRDTLLPNEDPKPFHHFRLAWIAEFSPQNCSELFLTERAVSLAWRLNRLSQADTGLHFNALCDFEKAVEKHTGKNPANPDRHPLDSLPPAMALADAFESDSKPNPFDSLSKTEHRLQSMLHRILKQLQTLQKHRQDNPTPPCPFLPEEDPGEIDLEETQTEESQQNQSAQDPEQNDSSQGKTEKAQNEPTEDPNPAPAPAHTGVACVVAHEKEQNEPTSVSTSPPA